MNKTSFVSKISNQQSYYSPDVWSKVERELDKKRKRRILLFFLFSILLMTSIGLGSFYFSQKNNASTQQSDIKKQNIEDPTNDIPKP